MDMLAPLLFLFAKSHTTSSSQQLDDVLMLSGLEDEPVGKYLTCESLKLSNTSLLYNS